MKLEPHFVIAEPFARQSFPVDSVFALLDVLLCRAALVVEADDPSGVQGQIGEDKTNTREQITGMPYHLGDDAAGLFP